MYYPKENYSTMLYHCASMVCYILDKCTYKCMPFMLSNIALQCMFWIEFNYMLLHFNIYIYNCMLLCIIIKG